MKKIFFLFLINSLHLKGSDPTKLPSLQKNSAASSISHDKTFSTKVVSIRISKHRIKRQFETIDESTGKFFAFSAEYELTKPQKYHEAEIVNFAFGCSPGSHEQTIALLLNYILARERISVDANSRYEQNYNRRHNNPINLVEDYLMSSRITRTYQPNNNNSPHSPTRFPKLTEKSS